MNKQTFRPLGLSLLIGLLSFAVNLLPLGSIVAAAALCCALAVFGLNAGSAASSVFLIASLLWGGLDAVSATAGCLVTALLLLWALRQQRAFPAALLAAAALLVGLFCTIVLTMLISGVNLIAYTYETLLWALDQMPTLYAPLFEGLSADTIAQTLSAVRAFYTSVFREELGAYLVLLSFALGVPLVMLLRRICKKHLGPRQPFVFFSVPRRFGTAILVCYAVFWLLSLQFSRLLTIALAMQSLFMALFCIQGLAVAAFVLQRRKLSRGGVAVLTALLSLLALRMVLLRMVLTMLGIFDTFSQLRLRLGASPDASDPTDSSDNSA